MPFVKRTHGWHEPHALTGGLGLGYELVEFGFSVNEFHFFKTNEDSLTRGLVR
mgnify:CR=1 FL=1